MFKYFVVFGLLSTLPAWSDPSSPPAPAKPTQLVSTPQGEIQTCDNYLPPGKARPAKPTATLFSFRLTAQGEIRDVALVRSSGDANLDQAALACANDAHMSPIKKDGVPIEVTWVRQVAWRPQWYSSILDASPSGDRYACGADRMYPASAVRLREEGATILSSRVAVDGSVKDVVVTQTSGFADLDQASIDCVSAWRYFPAMLNGQPVEIDKVSRINWRLSR